MAKKAEAAAGAEGSNSKEVPFEKTLERLEKIVEQLEDGEVPLEKSIALYEEGRRLGEECLGRLEKLERQVQLVREDAAGRLKMENFEEKDEG